MVMDIDDMIKVLVARPVVIYHQDGSYYYRSACQTKFTPITKEEGGSTWLGGKTETYCLCTGKRVKVREVFHGCITPAVNSEKEKKWWQVWK